MHTLSHTHIFSYRLDCTGADHMLIISPAELAAAVYSNARHMMWHLSYVHIIHIQSHLPSRSYVISSLTSRNVMSHWTEFCGSVNYGPCFSSSLHGNLKFCLSPHERWGNKDIFPLCCHPSMHISPQDRPTEGWAADLLAPSAGDQGGVERQGSEPGGAKKWWRSGAATDDRATSTPYVLGS